jgi:hypothetical protein
MNYIPAVIAYFEVEGLFLTGRYVENRLLKADRFSEHWLFPTIYTNFGCLGSCLQSGFNNLAFRK